MWPNKEPACQVYQAAMGLLPAADQVRSFHPQLLFIELFALLADVASFEEENLMTGQNLGIVFGPTLLSASADRLEDINIGRRP